MNRTKTLTALFLVTLFTLAAATIAHAQGNSGNRPGGAGRPSSGSGSSGRPVGSPRTNGGGVMDDRFGRSAERSNGRIDDRMNRSPKRKYVNGMPTKEELRRFNGIARKLETTPEALRDSFNAARKMNPDLKFGQFVAANVVADNLSARHPDITAAAILNGLENGDSLGRTLRNLGLPKDEARRAEKEARKQIEKSRKEYVN